MKLEYSQSELMSAIKTLRNFFAQVELLDPAAQKIISPETLQPVADYPADWGSTRPENGRHDQRAVGQKSRHSAVSIRGDHALGVNYQYVVVEGREFVLGMANDMTEALAMDENGLAAMNRSLQELNRNAYHDYVTGAYNRSYLDTVYSGELADKYAAGQEVNLVAVRVDHYEELCEKYGDTVKSNLMGYIVGLMQQQTSPENHGGIVIRMDENTILASDFGRPYADFVAEVSRFYAGCRKDCLVNIYKRLHFTLSIGMACIEDVSGFEKAMALIQKRLSDAEAAGGNCIVSE